MITFIAFIYLLSAICFILALKGLASPKSASNGNLYGIIGMTLAIAATMLLPQLKHHISMFILITLGGLIGAYIALTIKMTAIPQLVAGFHSLVGLAAVLVAYCANLSPESFDIGTRGHIHIASLIEMSLGLIVGAITFSGSIVAFLKLQGLISGKPIRFPLQQPITLGITVILFLSLVLGLVHQQALWFNVMAMTAFILGFLLIAPIGGADMPVVISMLNSYSGFAAAGIGFTLSNPLLAITGALVGASGAILSYIMCHAMNRSLINVIFSGLKEQTQDDTQAIMDADKNIQAANSEDAAYLLSNAKEVIIVPGYGMAVSHAQHAIKDLIDSLTKKGIHVRFAIHPVAGRMPGHMNVLLAEASIPYSLVFEQSEINADFASTDVVIVIGANDITNPAAKTNPSSPIYGMPILEVDKARAVLFIKRSLASGYAGVENELFYRNNTYMLFGDAKAMVEGICRGLD